MPQIKITEEELKVILLIKKRSVDFKDYKKFCELFCICLENKLFEFPKGYAGEKIIRWDQDGNMRQIESHKIDWRR